MVLQVSPGLPGYSFVVIGCAQISAKILPTARNFISVYLVWLSFIFDLMLLIGKMAKSWHIGMILRFYFAHTQR